MAGLQQFEKQQYLNIETFRKNGSGIKTPVWFVQDGDRLLVWTETSSGKAKRVRNNPQVKVVPSTGNGTPLGEWVPASAAADSSDAVLAHIKGLMQKKYGLAFSMFALLGKLRRSKYTCIRLQLG